MRPIAHIAALCIVGLLLGPRTASAAPGDRIARVVEAEARLGCASLRADSIGAARDAEGLVALARLTRCQLDEGAFDAALGSWAAVQDAVEGGRVAQADAMLAELAWYPELRARMLLHLGQPVRAATEFERLASSSHRQPHGVRARLVYYGALARQSAGEEDAARAGYRHLLEHHPGSRWASRAQLALVDEPLTTAGALAAATHALDGRHYAAAEALLRLAACGRPTVCAPLDALASDDPRRREAAYRLGHLLYRYRREHADRALPWLETVIAGGREHVADARHDYAAAVTWLGRYDEARRAWRDFARTHPEDARADGARYRVAWLLLEEDRYDEAIDGFDDYLRGGGERASAASWWIGWAHHQAGRCDEAIRAWRSLDVDRVHYWTAVCQLRAGDAAPAEAGFRRVHAADPWSWYGLLSARRLGMSPIPEDLGPGPGAEPIAGSAAAVAAGLGLSDEAHALARIESRTDDPFRQLAIAADPGDWVRWMAQWSPYAQSPPDGEAARVAWALAHPRFYAPTVEAVASDNGIPPELVWAVMQKESSYDTRALSVSDAMGLMQVIPQTAEAIAARIDDAYVDGMLFEPRHAIRYGGWYLGALSRKFGGQTVLAVAAYNAGPLAVEAWVLRNGGAPVDEFVEEIPFDQARDYVRRVIPVMARYAIAGGTAAALLADPDALFPERVTSSFTDEVEF